VRTRKIIFGRASGDAERGHLLGHSVDEGVGGAASFVLFRSGPHSSKA
jgi:hypothetical protein